MRKIGAGLFISLDGVTESPQDWNLQYFNDEMGQAIGASMAQTDTLLLGRNTFEDFAAYWPDKTGEDDPFAEFINNTPKVVVSTTLGEVDWQPTTVVRDLEAVRTLKKQLGKDIGMTGSVTLVRSLLQAGLLDELDLMIHPIVIGSGKRLFDDVTGQVPLELLRSETFKTGVISATYGPPGPS
ncbi:MAG: dihydrofolate reductase [Actinobacteria bacterium]|nr:MAG: dihydrofolate reductase [Actinomycetota bacterium]